MRRPLLLLLVLLLAACQPTPPPPATPQLPTLTEAPDDPSPEEPAASPTPAPDPVIVDVNLGLPPISLDPTLLVTRDDTAADMVENLFVGLTRLDPDTGSASPWLAREWEVSDDGLRWTFFLRDDVHWVRINAETGQMEQVRPVTSADAVYAIARVCSGPSNLMGLRAALFIAGCEAINETPDEALTPELLEQQLGVRVLNDVALEIALARPAAFLPELLTMPVFRPLPADLIEAEGDAWTQPDRILTSGPFTLQPTIPAEEGFTLVANQFWPFEREGNVSVVQIGYDIGGGYEAWLAGDVVLSAVPPEELADIDFEADPRYVKLARPGVAMLAASYDTFPMEKPGVRQAFALAIDRQRLVDELLAPNGVAALPAGGILPPGTTSTTSLQSAQFNPEAARAALAEAGHPDCILIPNQRLVTDESEFSLALAEAIVAQWYEVLGCPDGLLQIEQLPFNDTLDALSEPKTSRFQQDRPGFVTLFWEGDYTDAYHYFSDIVGCREEFPDAYINPARECVDADLAIDGLAEERDTDERINLADDLSAGFFGPTGEMPAIPLYYFARALAIAEGVEVLPRTAGPLQFDRWTVSVE